MIDQIIEFLPYISLVLNIIILIVFIQTINGTLIIFKGLEQSLNDVLSDIIKEKKKEKCDDQD